VGRKTLVQSINCWAVDVLTPLFQNLINFLCYPKLMKSLP